MSHEDTLLLGEIRDQLEKIAKSLQIIGENLHGTFKE